MRDRNIYDTIEKIEPIGKGLSEDKKYSVITADGTKYLLRISPLTRYESKKMLFSMMQNIAALNIPMCVPVEFGTCDDGVYTIQSWIDGEDLKLILPTLSETKQYALGIQAGKILKKIHSIPIPEDQNEWAKKYNREIDAKIKAYLGCDLHFDGDGYVLDYIEKNRNLLIDRPQSFLVWDYGIMNMMYENGEVNIIDFEYYNTGDPWNEFCCIVWSAATSPHFATGQIRGYFDGEPPMEFFELMVLYSAILLLSSLSSSWAVTTGIGREVSMWLPQDILKWHDNMKNPVPTWYLKDFYVEWIDGLPCRVQEPFDFSFLSEYGRVFKVFDEQGSGNIAFGVENGDKKYFVKFAGAPKPNYIANRNSGEVDVESAIQLLKTAVPLYKELVHPTLIKFIEAEEIGGGYAAVFEWEDAVGIEPKGGFDYMKFMQMPVEKKIRAFEDIMDFHAHVAAKGYVALDFYDGSILYDYDKEKVIICDIDLYQKSPFINIGNMGIVGSARYVSPEEFVEDAVMDEITNVYTMGATAFALFAYGNRSPEAWTLNKNLYDVVKKAVSDAKADRQQSIKQLIEEWRNAR
ncbi:MAG: phosphotransferase [Oscillospiraceae bacterium]|nr:phosphotransferase [Oscillospiraceae bacterium]